MTLLRTFNDADELVLHQLRLALLPDPAAIGQLAAVRGGLGVARSHVPDDQLHVALWSLDLPMMPPAGLVAGICAAAAGVRAPPLRIELAELTGDGEVTALRPGTPAPVLRQFQQRLALAMSDAGVWPSRGFRFEPQVVLAHGQDECFRRPVWPISWRAREFVLVHSLVGLSEPVALGRWTLAG